MLDIGEALAQERQKILAQIETAKRSHLFAGGLNEVWQAAKDGCTAVLLVEKYANWAPKYLSTAAACCNLERKLWCWQADL